LCLVSELQKINRTQTKDSSLRLCGFSLCNLTFRRNKFGPGAAVVSLLISELQELPLAGLELGTIFGVLTFLKYFCGLKGISTPTLVQIGTSVLDLQANI
jgi:hypothetical protein